jgi:uncharacterized membrane protein
MTWLHRYRLRNYVENSIWVLPLLGMVTALVAARALHWIERGMGEAALHPGAAQAVLGMLASSMFTFIVFVSSALLVAVQLASSQLTPRIIAIVFRDPVTKIALLVFVFTFAFRILVDIASKGLSPAINDPTTAVLALDQIHHLLRNVGGRRLDDGRVRDPEGRLRLVYPTPEWEDFVRLAVTEIRQFGATSIQIARRLRAMLENLTQTLPEERAVLLREELALLRRSAERFFAEPQDRAMAEVSDFQGVGGKHGQNQSVQAERAGRP